MVKVFSFAMLALSAFALTGCGPDDGRIDCSGVVQVDGAPMEGVAIAFVGGSGGVLASASTDAEGKFTARVAPGMNKVSVSKTDTTGAEKWAEMSDEEATMGTPEEVADMMNNQPKDLINPKFADTATSGLEFDIQAGGEPLKISVTAD